MNERPSLHVIQTQRGCKKGKGRGLERERGEEEELKEKEVEVERMQHDESMPRA